jgi:hypothetical protein
MLIPHVLNLPGQLVWPGTGRAEFGVERSATPCGFDNQNRLLQFFLHENSEGELRPDIAAHLGRSISTRAKAGGQLAQALAIGTAIIRTGQIGHPDLVTYPRGSIGMAHLLEHGCGVWILAYVVERADGGVSLHVRLTCENEHLEGFGG